MHRFGFGTTERYEELYCFSYNSNADEQERRREWALLDVTADYNRMGLPNALWKLSPVNQQYKVGAAATRAGGAAVTWASAKETRVFVLAGERHVPSRPVRSQVRHPSGHRWQLQVQKQRPIPCSVLLLQGKSSMSVVFLIPLSTLYCMKRFAYFV